MSKPIYAVCTLFIDGDHLVRSRTHGFFYSHRKAEKCVRQNWGDIYEHAYYNYALIEEFTEGLYNIGSTKDLKDREQWFKVTPREVPGENYLEYDVEKVECPKGFDCVVNFSMG